MRVVPIFDDIDTGGFFRAAADGQLAVRRCASCETVLHMPVGYCRNCGSFEGHWSPVVPQGRIYSYTVVTHQVHPDFPVPYTVLLIELDDVPEVRLVGRLEGRQDVRIGQRVVADFIPVADDAAFPTWRLQEVDGGGTER